MNTVPYIPFWHLYELKKYSTSQHHMNFMNSSYEQKLHNFKRPPWLVKGCAIFHHQTAQVFPASQQELYSLSPIQRAQGSFEPFGTGIAAVHYVKEPVSHLKANVCINWEPVNHQHKQYHFSYFYELLALFLKYKGFTICSMASKLW